MPRTAAPRIPRAVVAVAAVALVASGTLAVATALRPEDRASTRTASEDVDAATSTPTREAPLDQIAQQMEQRRIFALRSDRAYVEEVAAAPDAVESDWRGLRITPAEAAEFARQEGLHPKLDQMTAILEPLGALGGVWLENPVAEPQVMVVAIVGDVGADVRQRLLDVAGTDPLRLVPAQHTERQLRDLCDALVTGPMWAAGALTECAPDLIGDRVTVGVDLDAPADTEAHLAAEHGGIVSATRTPRMTTWGD